MMHLPRRIAWTALPRQWRRVSPIIAAEFHRHKAFDAGYDEATLAEARLWFEKLDEDAFPKGFTSYCTSSGPGGQHVNNTQSKARTVVPIADLEAFLPKPLHASLRDSRFYTKGRHALTFAAQTQRSRTMNAKENRKKLVDEIVRIYRATIPPPPNPNAQKRDEANEKKFHQARLKQKKEASARKQSRKGSIS